MGQSLLTGLWLEKCFIASPQLLLASHMLHCARSTVRMKALSSEAEQCSVQCDDCALCVPCSASLASSPQWPRSPPRPVGDWRPAVVFEHLRHVHSARAELRTPRRRELDWEWWPSGALVARGEARRAVPHSRAAHRRARVRRAAAERRHTHRTRAIQRGLQRQKEKTNRVFAHSEPVCWEPIECVAFRTQVLLRHHSPQRLGLFCSTVCFLEPSAVRCYSRLASPRSTKGDAQLETRADRCRAVRLGAVGSVRVHCRQRSTSGHCARGPHSAPLAPRGDGGSSAPHVRAGGVLSRQCRHDVLPPLQQRCGPFAKARFSWQNNAPLQNWWHAPRRAAAASATRRTAPQLRVCRRTQSSRIRQRVRVAGDYRDALLGRGALNGASRVAPLVWNATRRDAVTCRLATASIPNALFSSSSSVYCYALNSTKV